MLSAAASAHFSKVARRARIDLKLSSELVVENMKFHKVEFPQVASLVLNVPEKAGPVYKGMRCVCYAAQAWLAGRVLRRG